jgi:hypothetical protein
MNEPKTFDEALKQLIGEQLSSVEFVQDYLQLRFNGPCLTVYGDIHHVFGKQSSISWGQPGYRDTLCGLMAHEVRKAECTNETIAVIFDNEFVWSMSLREEDHRGPEALMYVDCSNRIWVL